MLAKLPYLSCDLFDKCRIMRYKQFRVFTVEQVDFVAEYFPTGERV